MTFSPFLITIELTPAEAARLSCGESKCSKNVNDPNLFAFPAQPGTRRVEQKETIFPLFVKLREREGQRVDLGRSLKGHL